MNPFKRLKQLSTGENGSSILLVGLALATLLATTGLVIDGGTLYVVKTRMQKAANAAVLSAAQELTVTEVSVNQVLAEVLEKHGEQTSVESSSIEMGHKVKVWLGREVPLGFSGLFGVKTAKVEVEAAAEVAVMGAAVGAAPLGIDESVLLEYNKEYKLKVDQTEVDTGNFGILALGDTGGKTYETNLKYGYQSELEIGDIIDTQTGNIVDKTREGVQLRLNECPYTPGDTSHRDCRRIILIPVYRPYQQTSNQMKQIKITGFAYFYITKPMATSDKTITGMFIKRADTGIADPNAVNRGAYAIRLTE